MITVDNCIVHFLMCIFVLGQSKVTADTVDEYLEAKMSVPELIKYKGYPAQIHHVTTDDGYILALHRIPFGRKGDSRRKRPVVLLSPGYTCSSAVFVVLGPEKALSYYLADRGFDVWILNYRGSLYSSNHTKLNVEMEDDEEAYFDYSWHEMGINDLPAAIDYILEVTDSKKLFHVGFSQGTTTFYVMMSEKPHYNNKIYAHISLAPVVYLTNAASPLMTVLAKHEPMLRGLAFNFGMYQINPWTSAIHRIMHNTCPKNVFTQFTCINLESSILGFNPGEYDVSRMRVIFGHFPDRASVKQLFHFLQLKSYPKPRFCQFDYGIRENILRYSSALPQEYKLNNTRIPVFMFYAENDWFVNRIDVLKLFQDIGSKNKYLFYVESYNHDNFIFGKNAHTVLYKPVAEILKKIHDKKKIL